MTINICEETEFKEPNVSNMQGLENDEPIPRGKPNETINFDTRRYSINLEPQLSGAIVIEKSDLCRLQDEDFRSRIAANKSGEHSIVDEYVNVERHQSVSEYDPVVHPDSKTGRLHLSIRYDDERSKLIVHILNAEGLIRPEQIHSPEMCLTFSLTGLPDHTEKHTRIVVDNAAISWKEPLTFCITFESMTKKTLYILASNKTDPEAIQDRELSIQLNDLGSQGEEINEWFDLQFVQSSN
ncbi:unnamed protein product [Adineta steineri]|uniref:C2 domain-containing protein n=2 Tax=Adineta steineri TaxID=433720 RepID=A0A819AVY6_9BILA|nr:unnamed protein product [Adineta steineri]